nr:hypothetical protein [Kibdelosporangium sp. MJ126-NF4]CEL19870.1 hypothetical protein [Kibdelosporangium sp. MJ126-NF4]CTQ97094.1 hypothetical protein [Kibdelosporangium sp. MJ126-NF4]
MSNPGFMGQQASQQASASASRASQQHASMASQHAMQHASSLSHRHHSRSAGRGGFGLLGRLVGLVFTLVSLAIAAGVFLLILSQAQPEWFHGVMTWLDRLF